MGLSVPVKGGAGVPGGVSGVAMEGVPGTATLWIGSAPPDAGSGPRCSPHPPPARCAVRKRSTTPAIRVPGASSAAFAAGSTRSGRGVIVVCRFGPWSCPAVVVTSITVLGSDLDEDLPSVEHRHECEPEEDIADREREGRVDGS